MLKYVGNLWLAFCSLKLVSAAWFYIIVCVKLNRVTRYGEDSQHDFNASDLLLQQTDKQEKKPSGTAACRSSIV